MAEHMAVNLGSRLWGPYKELYHTISLIVSKRCPDPYQELEAVLRKHKPDLVSLLKNPAKNAQHREQVKKADVEGIVVLGQATSRLLPRQLIKESLIVSDLFDLNEYAAVELLLAGDQQQPHFPGLTRGRVAVVLYYDGRCSLINALQLLIQARQGRTWTFDLEAEVVTLATSFTNDLISEGLVRKVLDFLKEVDINKEVNELAKERTTLGDSTHKHDSQIQEFLRGLRVSLADCLYCLACQTPLNRRDTILLAKHLMGHVELTAEGTLDEASIALLMAFLYSIDIGNIEQRPEDRDVLERKLPIVTDNQYLPDIHRLMTSQDEDQWKVGGIKGVLQLAWALTLRSAAQIPELAGFQDLVEEDEILVDRAMQANAFSFLLRSVVSNKVFHQNEFYVRRIHGLLTDFIVQMPLKVKEIRNRGDEAGRLIMSYEREGLEVSADLPRHFEDFMHLLGVLYENDPLQLELSLDFWNPPERTGSPGIGGASYLSVYYHKQSQRQVSLFKFVRMAGDLLPPSLYIPYLHLLTGLANGPQSAHQCFNLLKANGMGAGGSVGSVSWDHFFLSLNRYYSSLRQEVRLPSPFQELGQTAQAYRLGSKGITPHELEGLINVLKLVQAVARKDEEARLAMVENQSWLPSVLLFGLITCSIPPVLKGECLKTLAVFSQSPEIAATLWQSLEVSQVIPTVHQAGNPPAGILLELEEIESNNEEYPLTRGFLTLLDALTDIPVPIMLGVGYRPPGFDPYLAFLRDSVFLKFQSRAYRDPAEKWEVAAMVTKILAKLLAKHEPQPEDFLDQLVELQGGGTAVANKSPGHHLLVHMLNDSSMLQLILSILDQSTKLLSKYKTFPGKRGHGGLRPRLSDDAGSVLGEARRVPGPAEKPGSGLMVTPLDQFLILEEFVSFNVALPKHALAAVKVLYRMVRSSNVQPEIVNLFSINKESRHLLHGFVECLEVEDLEEVDQGGFQDEEIDDGSDENSRIHSQTRLYVMRLLLFSLSQTGPNLAHYLLGFNLRKPVSKTELQDPGVLGSPRTCLHSVLAVLERGLTMRTGPSAIHNTPQLAELAYELIYRLKTLMSDSSSNQEAWLLKSCCHRAEDWTTVNRQRSHSPAATKAPFGGHTSCGPMMTIPFAIPGLSLHVDMALHKSDLSQMRRKIPPAARPPSHFSQEVPAPASPGGHLLSQRAWRETIVHCQQKKRVTGVVLCKPPPPTLHPHGTSSIATAARESEIVAPGKRDRKVTVELLQELLAKGCRRLPPTDHGPYVSALCPTNRSRSSSLMSVAVRPVCWTAPMISDVGRVIALVGPREEAVWGAAASADQPVRLPAETTSRSLRGPRENPPPLQGAPALNSALLEEYERVTLGPTWPSFRSFGEAFCDLVCRDACDGHELGRTLALSVIDAVNTIDHRGHWLTFLAAKGYLRNFVEGLLHMDAALQQCLQPTPEPMKALYIYESTMSLLTRVAESVSGAQALLQMGLMARLAQCRFLDLRPDQSSHPIMTDGIEAVSVDSFLPDVMSRYRQLLFPVLRLSMTILTSLGCQHKEATSQVLHFIVSHSDTFTLILREQHQRPHKESLEELALVTGVVCSVMGEVDYFDPTLLELSGPSNVPLQTHLTRLHRQVVALVPRFSSLDQCLKELGTSEARHHGRAGQSEDRGGVAGGDEGGRGQSGRSALLEIISHVIGYCRTVVVRSGNTADECQILFTPSLQEAVARDYQRLEASSMASRDLSRPPSLGLIVRHLRQASAEFLVAMETHQQSLHKLQNVADLPAEELKELSKLWVGPGTKLSSQQRLHLATRQLTHEVRNRVQELSLLFCILDNHQPTTESATMYMSSPALNESDLYRQSLFPATSPEALGITQEDLKQLRVDATKCLSESLLKKTQEIEALFGAQRRSTRHSFVAALARRIRRLITLDAPR
ncbi:nuclear pore complex protein Nup205-like [Diadema antillarum]|uniref:nuclear pore complex protein Nup205-like n=1 Tax=Diadema antillarum TaxID=105358 RepID=UPI003A8950A9